MLVLAEVAVAFPLFELCQDLSDERFCGSRLVGAALLCARAEIAEPRLGSSLNFRLILFGAENGFSLFIVVHVARVSASSACWGCFARDGGFSGAHKSVRLVPPLLAATNWRYRQRWKTGRETCNCCNKSVSRQELVLDEVAVLG